MEFSHEKMRIRPCGVETPKKSHGQYPRLRSQKHQLNWAQQFASTFLDRIKCCSATAIGDLNNITDEADDSIYHIDDVDDFDPYDDIPAIEEENVMMFSSSTRQPHSTSFHLAPSSPRNESLLQQIPLQYTPKQDRKRILLETMEQQWIVDRQKKSQGQCSTLQNSTTTSKTYPIKRSSMVNDTSVPAPNPLLETFVDRACCHTSSTPHIPSTSSPSLALHNNNADMRKSSSTMTAPSFRNKLDTPPALFPSNHEVGKNTSNVDEEEIRSSATTQVVSHRTTNFNFQQRLQSESSSGGPSGQTTVVPTPPLIKLPSSEEERQDQEEEQAYRCLMRLERPNKIQK